MIEQLLFTE